MATDARFAELGVATTFEAAGGRGGLLAGSFVRVVPGSRAQAPARTALCGAAEQPRGELTLDLFGLRGG